MHELSIPCDLYRGGTSRGLLFLEGHLPYPRAVLDKVLLRIFGSPDVRQIDGVGGATSLTSKALVVGPDVSSGVDVRMTFAQIGVDKATVDWGGNCGNMTTAVGPFAIESGLVTPVEPVTVVRIRSVNTGVLVRAHVPVRDGRVLTDGDYRISGVPGCGARIDLEWLDPGGTVCGRLLPTGRPVDRFVLADRRQIDVSIVDAGNPVVFCDASALGLTGTELPAQLEVQRHVMETMEQIRAIAGEMLGIVPDRCVAAERSPGLPKVAFVAPPAEYCTFAGDLIGLEMHDLHARLLSMQTAHRSYAGAGAICTAVAALLPGTLVHACAAIPSLPSTPQSWGDGPQPSTVRIAHPTGVMDVEIRMEPGEPEPHVLSAKLGRTARRILSGVAWVPSSLLSA